MDLFKRTKKRKLVFLEANTEGYTLKEVKEVGPDAEVVKVKNKVFHVNKGVSAWADGPLIFDVDHAEPLTFEKIKDKKNPKDLGAFMQSSGLERLVHGNMQKILIFAIIGLVVAVAVVGMWGIYNLNEANKQLAIITMKYMNATTGGLIVK